MLGKGRFRRAIGPDEWLGLGVGQELSRQGKRRRFDLDDPFGLSDVQRSPPKGAPGRHSPLHRAYSRHGVLGIGSLPAIVSSNPSVRTLAPMDPSIRIEGLHDEEEPPVEGLARLIDATARHDGHRPIGEHALVELQAGPREFPHAAFVARLGDDLAGYAHLSQRETHLGWRFEAFVAPEHRRRGIGRALVAAVLDHSADDGGGPVHAWAYNPGPAQARLAASFGMRHVRTIARMVRSLPGPDPRLPAGFRLRAFRPDDVSTWLAVHNEVFVDHPDGGNWREPDLAWHLEEPWFDPELFVIAEDEAGMAGYCWMKPEGDTAWLYFLGVRSTARGRGLGQALAAEGLARAATLGAVAVQLYVDADSEPAIHTYRALGFTIDHVDRAFTLDVAATTRAEPTRG